MKKSILIAITLGLTIVLSNQVIDPSAIDHEMILKLSTSINEKPLNELPNEIQNLELISFGSSNDEGNSRSLLFSRLFKVNTIGMTPEVMLQISTNLEELADVEYCSLSPIYEMPFEVAVEENGTFQPPATTPDFYDQQGYLKDSSNGIHAQYAWDLGIFGEGVTFRDVEGAWDMYHEDLANIFVGLESKSNEWIDHGTNTIGVLMSQHNNFGVNGATPNAQLHTYSVYNDSGSNNDPGRTLAIAKAIEDANIGDIIILELQDRGYDQMTFPDYGPADVKMAIWDLVKAATDDSILVVAASGNGNQNLDGSSYSGYRARGDNGSILVGGGKPEDQSKTSSSGYGKMVSLQGWGYYVTTTGGNSMAEYVLQSGTHTDYTSNYSGTSSATPVVAAAMGLVQSWAIKNQGRYIGPYEMRDLLVSTGTPATGDKVLGPLPNVQAAIEQLIENDATGTEVATSFRNSLSLLSITPNQIQLEIPVNGDYSISLHSLSGRVISSFTTSLSEGISVVPLDAINLGMYLLSIEGESFSTNTKCLIRQ